MRLIDADAVLDKSCWLETHVPTRVAPLRTEIVYADELRGAPTIDAVSVVRCRECMFNGNFPEIPLCRYVNYPNFERNGDGYCSMGQRRGDGDA